MAPVTRIILRLARYQHPASTSNITATTKLIGVAAGIHHPLDILGSFVISAAAVFITSHI
jgi:hypothetical protein